ncbi:hypothetical protein LJB87_02620 [Alistipes sp. OttesenSCG-928-L06]|nr:hypothetical protein [Alistipes sp. OttesenSCG-928-L06]
MKKILLLLALALPVFPLASCSDDDDDPTLAESVTGIYDVTASIAPKLSVKTSLPEWQPGEPIAVKVIATGDNKVSLNIDGLTFYGFTIRQITMPDIRLTMRYADPNHIVIQQDADVSAYIEKMRLEFEDIPVEGAIHDLTDLELEFDLNLEGIPYLVRINGSKR